MSELKINVRLDEQSAGDLQFLCEALGDKSITEVLKYSLQQVAQDFRDQAKAKQQKQLWRESRLTGYFEGEEDLSINYKQHIADYLDKKYPQHQPPEE